jgi:hypothetical protein
MIDRDHEPAERTELSEQELAIAALVGRYIERRERQAMACVHNLLAADEELQARDRRRGKKAAPPHGARGADRPGGA